MDSVVYDVTIFGIHLSLKPVAFTLPIGKDGWSIYWYGILISIGFLAALIYAFKKAKSHDLDVDRMIDVILVATPIAIIFARLYYIIFDGSTVTSFKDIISIHDGGLAIYGGIIGAFLSAAIMCKIRKVNMLALFDLAGISFLLAQSIGRWGNFVNQEAYGKETGSQWWGMTSDKIQTVDGVSGLVHPCFLYESIWCLIGFFLLNSYSKRKKFKGEVFLGYAVWYGFGRFFIEGLRTDQLLIGSLPVSQLVAALSVIAGIILIIVFRGKAQDKNDEQSEYVPLFGDVQESDNTESDASADFDNEAGVDDLESEEDNENAEEELPENETENTGDFSEHENN